MTAEQILGCEHRQTLPTFLVVWVLVSGPVAVQLVLTVERLHTHATNESSLNPMYAFDMIVPQVSRSEVRITITTCKLKLFVHAVNVLLKIFVRFELLVAHCARKV